MKLTKKPILKNCLDNGRCFASAKLRKKCAKSLPCAESLNFPPFVVNSLFKLSAQGWNLAPFLLQCDRGEVKMPCEIKLPLVPDCFLYTFLSSLEFGIDVAPWINVAAENFDKKNRRSPLKCANLCSNVKVF